MTVSSSMKAVRMAFILGLFLISKLSSQAQPYEPGSYARAVGRAIVDREIARYGRVSNPAWDHDIGAVLNRLEQTSGYPGLQVTYVVVGDSDFNAEAVPGRALVVNAGLMVSLTTLASNATSTPQSQHVRFVSYLAAVLAHELAHITLGHTDSLLRRASRLAKASGVPDSLLYDAASYGTVVKDSGLNFVALAQSREREFDADRVGSLYLLRAGWTIQTAMDLMLALDSLERADPSFYQTVTYVRTHPRASAREAALESFRAQLKALQADYDDALSLIENDVALPTAVSMLDTILAYFPDMLPALHARGTAYHELWLKTVPVPLQKVRASLTTYSYRFLPLIRGAPGNMTFYGAAKADYAAVLARESLPLTLAQEALLDAYAGDCAGADQGSLRATNGDSLSVDINNDRGVALFVCNRSAEALTAFRSSQRLAGTEQIPTLQFNIARALKAVGDSGAAAAFRAYLSIDSASEWAAEARRQLGGRATAETPTTSTARSRRAPTVQGIELGDPLSKVDGAWGQPSATSGDTLQFLTYQTRGLRIAVSPSLGVVFIGLLTREAGAVDGVRVGDGLTAARAAWGSPAERRNGYQFFNRGRWSIIVGSAQSTISGLGISTNP